ncbi:MAG TPA: UDP-glucose 4-epimerase GalE, partial [Lysinibacillus sp.]|nr:UDP-glucose 4-epimerase GalE [Lysinibacillus sp.]
PARLVANANKIYSELGWKARLDIQDIIKSAWFWHKKQF